VFGGTPGKALSNEKSGLIATSFSVLFNLFKAVDLY
jgi:hypothetical protein